MDPFLRKQFDSALQQASGSHSQNIARDQIAVFVRVARVVPSEVVPVIQLLLANIDADRSNVVSSLFCMIRLADVSQEMRDVVRNTVGEELLAFYVDDDDEKIAGNAAILRAVIEGAPMSQFEGPKTKEPSSANVTYNLHQSNLAINSPDAQLSLRIENYETYDPETQRLLEELKVAMETKDRSRVMKGLGFIADKSVDLLVAVVAGKVITGG